MLFVCFCLVILFLYIIICQIRAELAVFHTDEVLISGLIYDLRGKVGVSARKRGLTWSRYHHIVKQICNSYSREITNGIAVLLHH